MLLPVSMIMYKKYIFCFIFIFLLFSTNSYAKRSLDSFYCKTTYSVGFIFKNKEWTPTNFKPSDIFVIVPKDIRNNPVLLKKFNGKIPSYWNYVASIPGEKLEKSVCENDAAAPWKGNYFPSIINCNEGTKYGGSNWPYELTINIKALTFQAYYSGSFAVDDNPLKGGDTPYLEIGDCKKF